METQILDASGQPIVLNQLEKAQSEELGRKCNALGFEINITTLTTVMKKITSQKYYEIAFADFLPVRVGEGAWSTNLVTYRDYSIGNPASNFLQSALNQGVDNVRLSKSDTGIDSLSLPVFNWAGGISWNLLQLNQAAKSGSWDLVSSKERSRKKEWDLGLQQIAFLGSVGGAATSALANQCLGLLNQNLDSQIGSQIPVSTTVITQPIYKLASSPNSFNTLLQSLLNSYRVSSFYSAWPTAFIMPESDYLGCASASSPSFPLISILDYLQNTFRTMTGNQNFKIMPLRYCDAAVSGGLNQQYVLLNQVEESVRMDIPVDYTNTLANSIDNFAFQNAAYGQFTGVKAYRPQELQYFTFPASNGV